MGKNNSVAGTPLVATLRMLPQSNENLVTLHFTDATHTSAGLTLLGVWGNFIPLQKTGL